MYGILGGGEKNEGVRERAMGKVMGKMGGQWRGIVMALGAGREIPRLTER